MLPYMGQTHNGLYNMLVLLGLDINTKYLKKQKYNILYKILSPIYYYFHVTFMEFIDFSFMYFNSS